MNLPTFLAHARICNRKTKRCVRVKTKFGIDTGATTTFASMRAIPFFQYELKLGSVQTSRIMAGTPAGPTALERSETINLCVAKSCVKGLSFVPADVPADIMLGADFLDANKCSVGFHPKKLKCKGLSIKLEARR